MQNTLENSPAIRAVLVAGGVVLLVAGLRASSSILVPLMAAVFLAILVGPAVFFLKRLRFPSWLAVLIVVLSMMAVLGMAGIFLSSSLNRFLLALPEYDARFNQEVTVFAEWLSKRGIRVSGEHLIEALSSVSVLDFAGEILSSVGVLITDFLLVTLTLVFILLEAYSFPRKLRTVIKNADATLAAFEEFAGKLNRYVAIKTLSSLLTAVGVGAFNFYCEIEFAFLWAIVAFLLNYIPNLGSIIAAIPPVVLAFLRYGIGAAAIVALGYLVINLSIANLLEPRLLGRGLGLSTLVVFASLVIWAWILGPAGMLLAVPLTVTIKVALESNMKTRPIALLLGPPGDDPDAGRPRLSEVELEEAGEPVGSLQPPSGRP